MDNKELKNKSVALATIVLILGNASYVFADNKISKNETVYSILDENGNVNKNIVSAWINGSSSLGTIHDVSTLTNIKNVKGDEKPSINGDKVTWNVSEDDLYYQGKTNKSLPLDVNIKYELNGQEVTPKDIQGKTGQFKITLSLKNNESRQVKINGKNRTIYVPFITASEIILKRDNFKDIKTSTGTLLDEGNNSAITFVSIPGFKESLNLDNKYSSYLNLKDEIVIEGNTTGFKTPTIMIAATSDVSKYLEDIDEDTNLSDLKDSLNKLQDAGQKLVDGAKKVSDGASTLNTNYKKFNDGVKTLDSGITTLNNGASQLVTKLPELNNGAQTLSNGLGTLSSSSKELSNGVSEVSDGVSKLNYNYSTLDNGINSAYKGSLQLESGAATLNSGAKELESKLSSGGDGLKELQNSTSKIQELASNLSSIANQLRNSGGNNSNNSNLDVSALVEKAKADGDEDLAQQIQNLNVNTNSNSSANYSGIADELDKIAGGLNQIASVQSEGLNTLANGINAAVKGAQDLANGLSSFKDSVSTLSSGLSDLKDGSSSVSSGLNDLSNGASSLADGSAQLAKGAASAYNGSKTLASGTSLLESSGKQLASGVGTLKSGSSALATNSDKILSGIGTLSNGTDELYSGTKKLQSDGLDKLTGEGDTLISSLDGAMEVKNKLIDAADSYDNFTGLNKSMDGSVKFVMKVQSADSENNSTKSNKLNTESTKNSSNSSNTNSNFMDWLKSKFNK